MWIFPITTLSGIKCLVVDSKCVVVLGLLGFIFCSATLDCKLDVLIWFLAMRNSLIPVLADPGISGNSGLGGHIEFCLFIIHLHFGP